MRDATAVGKGREYTGPRKTPRGLLPFQRGLIWSITSVKCLYNDLIVRYGGVNMIPLQEGINENDFAFKCLNMERLSYTVIIQSKRVKQGLKFGATIN